MAEPEKRDEPEGMRCDYCGYKFAGDKMTMLVFPNGVTKFGCGYSCNLQLVAHPPYPNNPPLSEKKVRRKASRKKS
jgi:hypothetical protein